MPRAAPDAAQVAITKELRKKAGQWLKGAREAVGLTQAELAERVGLRYYTFVSQVESGLGRVPIDQQAAWAETLGINPRDFATRLLGYYEPELYRLLFSDDTAARKSRGAHS